MSSSLIILIRLKQRSCANVDHYPIVVIRWDSSTSLYDFKACILPTAFGKPSLPTNRFPLSCFSSQKYKLTPLPFS